MKNWNKICGLFLIFFLTYSFSIGQVNNSSEQTTFSGIKAPQKFIISGNFLKNRDSTKISGLPVYLITHTGVNVPPDFYTRSFGFFCRKELQLEKCTGIPFRFRLGSLQQCNVLEGKQKQSY